MKIPDQGMVGYFNHLIAQVGRLVPDRECEKKKVEYLLLLLREYRKFFEEDSFQEPAAGADQAQERKQ